MYSFVLVVTHHAQTAVYLALLVAHRCIMLCKVRAPARIEEGQGAGPKKVAGEVAGGGGPLPPGGFGGPPPRKFWICRPSRLLLLCFFS